MKRRVLITGAGGMLGRQLLARAPDDVEVLGCSREELDVCDRAAVFTALEERRPDTVIHAAAMTAVDACESEVEQAFRVNGVATRDVAEACARHGVDLMYISTDYVFDGRSDRPYRETDPVRPLSVYGQSKEWGERAVRAACPGARILRTQWVYGPGGPNFVDTMLRLAEERKPLRVVDDQLGCPTSTLDLADGLWAVHRAAPGGGTYHLSSGGETSWYGFAREIFRLAGLAPALTACRTKDFPRPAPRPAYGVLRNLHLELTCGDPMPSWEDGIARYLDGLQRDPGPRAEERR